jgi:type III secretory pathway component EscS
MTPSSHARATHLPTHLALFGITVVWSLNLSLVKSLTQILDLSLIAMLRMLACVACLSVDAKAWGMTLFSGWVATGLGAVIWAKGTAVLGVSLVLIGTVLSWPEAMWSWVKGRLGFKSWR